MSVYANTLNAYAARLKAQRKAAEREAELAARRKSAEEKNADKMRIEQARAERQAQYNEKNKITATKISCEILNQVTRSVKELTGSGFSTGERSMVTADLTKISELFFYKGQGKYHLKVNVSSYSTPAYMIMINTLAMMRIITPIMAVEAIDNPIHKQIVVLRDGNKVDVFFTRVGESLNTYKSYVADHEHMRKEYAV